MADAEELAGPSSGKRQTAPVLNAHRQWRKIFKVFKANQAFLHSTRTPTLQRKASKNRPDPVYLALKRAQMMGAVKYGQFSRSLDLDSDLYQGGCVDSHGGNLPSTLSLNLSKLSIGEELNKCDETSSSSRSSTKLSELPSPNRGNSSTQPSKASTLTKGCNSTLQTLQDNMVRARSQPPIVKGEDHHCKKAAGLKKEKLKLTTPMITDRRQFKVPPLKKLYSIMQEKEAVFNERLKTLRKNTVDQKNETYAVIHEFRAKFPGELELRPGEKVTILDTVDADWWTGFKGCEPVGRFPSTCVNRLRLYEQIFRVKQNLQLWDDKKKLRLYRDQVVFGQGNVEGSFITIRTTNGVYINCPLQQLVLIK